MYVLVQGCGFSALLISASILRYEVCMVTPYYKRHNRTSDCSFWFSAAFSLLMYVNGMANLYKMRVTNLCGNEDQLKKARKQLVDTKSWRYCEKCGDICPPRSHHCPLCDVCVLRRDHHCWFAGCCVGISNHRCECHCFFSIITFGLPTIWADNSSGFPLFLSRQIPWFFPDFLRVFPEFFLVFTKIF